MGQLTDLRCHIDRQHETAGWSTAACHQDDGAPRRVSEQTGEYPQLQRSPTPPAIRFNVKSQRLDKPNAARTPTVAITRKAFCLRELRMMDSSALQPTKCHFSPLAVVVQPPRCARFLLRTARNRPAAGSRKSKLIFRLGCEEHQVLQVERRSLRLSLPSFRPALCESPSPSRGKVRGLDRPIAYQQSFIVLTSNDQPAQKSAYTPRAVADPSQKTADLVGSPEFSKRYKLSESLVRTRFFHFLMDQARRSPGHEWGSCCWRDRARRRHSV